MPLIWCLKVTSEGVSHRSSSQFDTSSNMCWLITCHMTEKKSVHCLEMAIG